MQRICFFIGSRDVPHGLREELCRAVEEAVTRYHAALFVTGGRGRFDAMAAEAVQQLRARYPWIRLCLLLAYHPAQRPVLLPPYYDESLYPLEKPVPPRCAIMCVNRWMLRHCEVCIAGALLPGNARRMLEYARRRAEKGKLKLIELRGTDSCQQTADSEDACASLVPVQDSPTTCSC